MAYVYFHRRNDNNDIFYIGSSIAFDNYDRAFSKRKRNSRWIEVVFKTDYKIEIVYDNISVLEARTLERQLIKEHHKTLTNYTCMPVSEETKKKISLGLKGQISWNKGLKFSEESKKKMSASRKGKTPWNKGLKGYKYTKPRKKRQKKIKVPKKFDFSKPSKLSLKHREAIFKSNQNRVQTEESKRKRSESLKKYHANKKSP